MAANTLVLTHAPQTAVSLLIRRATNDVFNAFVDPAITTQFWFTKGSGHLAAERTIRWEWEMYGVGTDVKVNVLEPEERIQIEWESEGGSTIVEWHFQAVGDGATFVTVSERGFHGEGDALVRQVLDSTQGFSLVLAGAKAWLEHGIRLNLVADHTIEGAGLEA